MDISEGPQLEEARIVEDTGRDEIHVEIGERHAAEIVAEGAELHELFGARSQREACLENLKNIHFVSSFRPDQFKSSYQILYGAAPKCPAGGRYSNELPVSCSVHGTISGGSLKPVPDFFKGVGSISVQSFINPEGFQSEVRFFPE